ncbi:hypothetical protein I2486_18770 [Cellulophaga sp. E16_2]|uniref:Secreted protein n=1 Tax=Cellulophaga algicola (strain DSM 14237 / IC166 / ACAM 630) TaxID=688270 RepID=E6XBE1_CELAD|nr:MULTISPECIES: hypothetical protein [Cellulophaga]ADV51054.1 hypothetical protein Celal_3805 [Cellulophaga algicola DSM 14237]MBO0593446.1 hypothetical protein [Cellulophaga sp. E16_2]
MKLLKITLIALLVFPMFMSAQSMSDHTIGLRLGDSDGLGAEISYQKSLSTSNRLEVNLGFRDSRAYDAFKISGLYEWVLPLDGDFNWYYGVGGGLGNVNFERRVSENNPNGEEVDGGLFVFAAGNIGVEYNFDFPLVISLDMRPEIGLLGYSEFSDNFDFDIGLGIRYQF